MNSDAALVWSCIDLFQPKLASEFTENCHTTTDGNWINEKMIFIDQVMLTNLSVIFLPIKIVSDASVIESMYSRILVIHIEGHPIQFAVGATDETVHRYLHLQF